jgi:hypothetical protein
MKIVRTPGRLRTVSGVEVRSVLLGGRRVPRYCVVPCDDLGSVEGGKSRTWDVFDRLTKSVAANRDTRRQARDVCDTMNLDWHTAFAVRLQKAARGI